MPLPRKKVPGRVLGELRQAVRGNTKEPRISELVQHFFDLAGGERAVAKMMLDALQSPTTTAHVKSRILEVVLRSLQFANSKTPPRDDLGSLSEEDIERELFALYEESDRAAEKAGPQTAPDAG